MTFILDGLKYEIINALSIIYRDGNKLILVSRAIYFTI